MSKFDNSAFSATEGCVAEPACGVWGHCTTAWAETRARAATVLSWGLVTAPLTPPAVTP